MTSEDSTTEQLNLVFQAESPVQVESSVPRNWWIWGLLGIAAGLGGWWFGRYYLTQSLSDQLAGAQTRAEAVRALEGLLMLGDDASMHAVRGLEHKDKTIARAAYRTLDSMVTMWQENGDQSSNAQVVALAKHLHDLPSTTSPGSLVMASGLALRLHSYCSSTEDPQLSVALPLCEAIVQRASENSFDAQNELRTAKLKRIEESINLSSVPPPPLAPEENPSRFTDGQFTDDATGSAKSRPGAAVPLLSGGESVHSSSGGLSSRAPVASLSLVNGRTQPRSGQRVRIGDTTSIEETSASYSLKDNDADSPVQMQSRDEYDLPVRLAVIQNSLIQNRIDLNSVINMEIDELVRLLGNTQPGVAQEAALALKEKGMTGDRLALASELATSSAARRLELIDQIVRADMDPEPWLMWMAEAQEPEVRQTAISAIAAFATVDTQRKIRHLLGREQHPGVAETMRKTLVATQARIQR